jgi:hypothetical protein
VIAVTEKSGKTIGFGHFFTPNRGSPENAAGLTRK